ncbi:oxygen-dependent protoporphyrinogen oxidase [Streptosporangium becharense]|uniref:Coproporphyrinogen III oxidase n=1 Tax=Streptosporangium becharense TaxID=1816182 RepID=A0A7W9MJB6_9ACTN|nr:protoporphyrinogen oxidase [Streptosporangium becharense]MBB2911779.1 oxygen-dependent protoporphyrinogen oxidase [Streptosporangium becharense]MBB5822403.1 oxygen-dependent protoporphyrinogen oxidase [Streptosporangium becharense]
MEGKRSHVVVVGGGIAGLAAAWYLRQGGERVRVTVLDGAPRIGGKLHATEVAGVPVDAGAEAMLARRPEGRELARMAGLGDDLRDPGTTRAAILSRGALRPLPQGQVMGVPSDLAALARSGILSPGGLARVPLDQILPATLIRGDVSVAAYIRARMGGEVVDRLVEPLLGGVYAGVVERLSLDATMPRIAIAARSERSLLGAARRMAAEAPKDAGPVFATLRRGMGSLPEAVAAASGAEIRTGVTVRELHRTEGGWRLVTGPVPAPEVVEADAVVVAVPAPAAGRLLAGEVPQAAAELARIEYASMAVVTLAYPREAFPRPPDGSGYLVPAVDGRPIKAVTFSSVKWPHLAEAGPELVVLRCSIGRLGEEAVLQRDDAELVALAMAEMVEVMGVRGLPRDSRVTRWGGSLPQYEVGHLNRVARIRAAIASQPSLALCGAAYDGVGIPACISTARTAATRILDHLDPDGEWQSKADSLTKG